VATPTNSCAMQRKGSRTVSSILASGSRVFWYSVATPDYVTYNMYQFRSNTGHELSLLPVPNSLKGMLQLIGSEIGNGMVGGVLYNPCARMLPAEIVLERHPLALPLPRRSTSGHSAEPVPRNPVRDRPILNQKLISACRKARFAYILGCYALLNLFSTSEIAGFGRFWLSLIPSWTSTKSDVETG